jgi:hypothetical protein
MEKTTKADRIRNWLTNRIADKAEAGELPTTLRYLFYEAVTAGIVPKKTGRKGGRRPDADLIQYATELREKGIIPWGAIVDESRTMMARSSWETPTNFLDEAIAQYRLDPWAEADARPVLFAESAGPLLALDATLNTYSVAGVPTRGQTNGFLRTTVARSLAGQDIDVLYLGDFDKAGVDIENNTLSVLVDAGVGIAGWRKVALTAELVDSYGIALEPRRDGRNGLVYEVAELESLPQSVVETLVVTALDDLVDIGDVLERESTERAELELWAASR